MSWSLPKVVGHPEALKPVVAKQMDICIEQVKNMPHEHCQAVIAKSLLMEELDFLSKNDNPAVEVEASGSASEARSGYVGNSQIKVSVVPIWNFQSK